ALITVLLATALAGVVVQFPAELAALGRHTVAATTFSANILLWLETGYFDQAADAKPLLHLWSLGVEEQFYLIWPLALLLLVRRHMLTWIAFLAVASFIANAYLVRSDASIAFFSIFTRLWELAAGGLLA